MTPRRAKGPRAAEFDAGAAAMRRAILRFLRREFPPGVGIVFVTGDGGLPDEVNALRITPTSPRRRKP